jgi:hypothetical protein
MTTPNLTLRASRQVELTMPHRRDLLAFQVGAANTLDVAFAGTTAMFQVKSGQTFRSPGIRARRLGRTQYENRGLTRVVYDPQDYWVAAGALPTDAAQGYIRVAGVSPDGTVRPEGPIYIVPPPGFYSNPRPSLAIVGTAPSVTVPATLVPPPEAMAIVLPQFADNVRIQNLDVAVPLLVGVGPGQPMISIAPETSETLYDAVVNQMWFAGDGATVAFDARFAIVNGEMA